MSDFYTDSKEIIINMAIPEAEVDRKGYYLDYLQFATRSSILNGFLRDSERLTKFWLALNTPMFYELSIGMIFYFIFTGFRMTGFERYGPGAEIWGGAARWRHLLMSGCHPRRSLTGPSAASKRMQARRAANHRSEHTSNWFLKKRWRLKP